MKRIRSVLFTVLAVIVVVGVCGQPALAQDEDTAMESPQVHMATVDRYVPGTPDTAAALLAGLVAWGYPPPVNGPPPSWPCFAPNAPCSSDPAGGLLVGIPVQYWPISGTTNCTMVPCGQIYALYQTTTASGTVGVTITIKQSTTTIFSYANKNVGSASANQIGILNLTGVQLMNTAIAGSATISVTTSVGQSKVTGKAIVNLM